jgi:glyoxylate/hydroxypyruvate reductase A
MVILLVTSHAGQAEIWRSELAKRLPDVELRVYPQTGDPTAVEVALAWKAPHGVLAGLPQLRLICSLGMGLDHLLEDPTLPVDVPIVRLVDPNMVRQMSEYALYAVLHFHRRFDVYARFQEEQRWEELPLPHTERRHVGVMGLGEIGADCARKLAALGFQVSGWSRSARDLPGIRCFSGESGLSAFLTASEILVVVLPLTAATAGIVNARTIAFMPRGAYIVNTARGALLVEQDLLAALDSGQLAGVMLDVTQTEPLPPSDPLWRHPNVRITPHIAGLTNPYTAIEPIVDNIRRLQSGLPLEHLVDRSRGY